MRYTTSPEILAELKRLSKVEMTKQISYFILNWVFIVSVAYGSERFFSLPGYLLSVFLIGARQHAFLVLVHDAAHYRVSQNKMMNDLISNILGGFACMIGTNAYRIHHMAHHQFLNTPKDPDFARKAHLAEWQFPMAKIQLAKVLMKQFWLGGYEWIRLMSMMTIGNLKLGSRDQRRSEAMWILGFWLIVMTISFCFHYSQIFLLYWLVPLITVFPFLQRIRSISEHFGISENKLLSFTRNTKVSRIEGFLLSPYSVNWHVVHHLFPAIPHFHLSKAHSILCHDKNYQFGQHLNSSYLLPYSGSVLSDLVRKKSLKPDQDQQAA